MRDKALLPATPEEVAERIAFALKFRRDGKAARTYDSILATAAGAHIVEMLRVAGYEVFKRPPLEAHSGPSAWRDPDGGKAS